MKVGKVYKITTSNLNQLIGDLTSELDVNETLEVSVKPFKKKRSLSQNAFQHIIYKEISDYLISRGRKDWTPSKTKEALKNQFLGWIDEEFTDLITGEVTTKQVLRSTSGLDKGESYHFTTQILDWAESIGLTIKIPATCEYRKLQQEQIR